MIKKISKILFMCLLFSMVCISTSIVSHARTSNDEVYDARGPRCWCWYESGGWPQYSSDVDTWFGAPYYLCTEHGVHQDNFYTMKEVQFDKVKTKPTCTSAGSKDIAAGVSKGTSVDFACVICVDNQQWWNTPSGSRVCVLGDYSGFAYDPLSDNNHGSSNWAGRGYGHVPKGDYEITADRVNRYIQYNVSIPAKGHYGTTVYNDTARYQHYYKCERSDEDHGTGAREFDYANHNTFRNQDHQNDDWMRHWDCNICTQNDTKLVYNVINHVFRTNKDGSKFASNNSTEISFSTSVDNVAKFTSPTPGGVTGYTFRGWVRRPVPESTAPVLGYTGSITTAANVTKTGRSWDFDSHAKNHNGGTYYLDGAWKRNTYYVAYSIGSDRFADACPDKTVSGTTTTKTCEYDITYNHHGALTNKYYYFIGWKLGDVTSAGGSEFKNLTSTGGATVTEVAQWNPKTYTIKYNTNRTGATGADNTVSSISVESSGNFWTPTAAYASGYYVDHWNTKADGTGTNYALGEGYSAFWYQPSSNTEDVIQLYAIWKPYTYEVTYKAGTGIGDDVVETWTVDAAHYLYNNTPNLSATLVTGASHNVIGEPHFTKEGYYVDYWVPSFPTSTYEPNSQKTANAITGTGYNGDNVISKFTSSVNLLIPGNSTHNHIVSETKGFGEKVVLTAHWAPIKYKVVFYNDSTVPGQHGAPYEISSNTFTSEAYNFGESYEIPKVDFTRKNKYGISTFLGYCFYEGCISKNPTFVVKGQSPEQYLSGRSASLNQISFAPTTVGRDAHSNSATTAQGTTWSNYFKYLNDGSIQNFKLYAAWDDCPGIEPVDVEQQKDRSDEQYKLSTPGIGTNTKSGKDLEYYILHLDANEGSIWDREDDVSSLATSKDHYYIKNFENLGINAKDQVSSYKLTFVIKDSYGHTYETSRKLYSGLYYDIMLHKQVSQFSQ